MIDHIRRFSEMDKKMMVCNFIGAIGNIINGILGFYSGRRGFSIFMIIIGALCLLAYITDMVVRHKDKDD